MKNKLLITTALVTLISASNAYAMEINSDKEITGENQAININNKLIVSDGNLIATDTEIHSYGVEVNGGTITLNGTDFTNDNNDDNPDNSFKINDGTVIMNGRGSVIGTNERVIGDNISEAGKFEMTGGKVVVNGGVPADYQGNYIEGSEININGGELVISEGAYLETISGAKIKDPEESTEPIEPEELYPSTINLTDEGTINISGTLVSDVSGDSNLNVKSSSALVDGDVEGSNLTFEADHSLSKAISGEIGDLASLNVNKETLTYDRKTGKIGSLNVAGGLDIGTNTVKAGNVEFKDNSNLALRVSSTDSYGNINADNITIGDETTIKVTLDNGVVGEEGETFKFLNSENINGEFTNKIAENNRYDIVQNEDGSFNITNKDTTASEVVSDASGTANNAATAEAWETISNSSDVSEQAKEVSNALFALSQETSAAGKQAYVDALTAVAPEVAPMVQQTQTETANQVFGAVSTRLTDGSISTGSQGMSSGDSNPDAAVWVQGMFNKSKLDDTSKAKGFDADSNGIAMGIEKYLNRDVKAGIGYAYTNTDIDGFMRDTDVDTHTAIVYGEYKPSNWYVNGIATYGWSDYSEDKNVAGVGVKADYDVETFGLQAMTGYDMNINGFGLTPEAGLRYVHIKQDAYTDSADQKVSGNDSDILTGVIGAKVSRNFELSNGMNIKPEARIAATYDLMNDDVNSVVTLANGSAYAVDGEALDRFGMEFGVGVTAELNTQVELSLGYEGKFREDYQDHTGLINAKYKF